jgi:hypothetical protein
MAGRRGARAGWLDTPWLTADEYKAFARIDPSDTSDDVAIDEAVAATVETLEDRAALAFATDVDGAPVYPACPARLHESGLLLVNRLLSRRNSPDGIVGLTDMGTAARVASKDSDVLEMIGPFIPAVLA